VAGLATAVTGSLNALIGASGACVRSKAPLELRGPFPGAAYYLRNVTAGVFGGDAYEVDVTAAAGSVIRIASSSATKVHDSAGRESSLRVRLAAEPGATLLWGPHATIIQTGASYRQSTTVSLAPGSRVVLGEILVLGRLARGEQFEFTRLESNFDVTLEGAAVYSEAYCLTPGADLAASMAGRGVLASVYILGAEWPALEERLICTLKNEPLAGCSALPNDAGVVVRCFCDSLSQGQALVEGVLRLVSDR